MADYEDYFFNNNDNGPKSKKKKKKQKNKQNEVETEKQQKNEPQANDTLISLSVFDKTSNLPENQKHLLEDDTLDINRDLLQNYQQPKFNIDNIFRFNTKFGISKNTPCIYIFPYSKQNNFQPITTDKVVSLYHSGQINSKSKFRPLDLFMFKDLKPFEAHPLQIIEDHLWVENIKINECYVHLLPQNKINNNNEQPTLSLINTSDIHNGPNASAFFGDTTRREINLFNHENPKTETQVPVNKVNESGIWEEIKEKKKVSEANYHGEEIIGLGGQGKKKKRNKKKPKNEDNKPVNIDDTISVSDPKKFLNAFNHK